VYRHYFYSLRPTIALMSSGTVLVPGAISIKGNPVPPRLFFVLRAGVCCCYRERCRPATVARRQTQNAACSLCKASHSPQSLFTGLESGLSRPAAHCGSSLSPLTPPGPLAFLSFPPCPPFSLLCGPTQRSGITTWMLTFGTTWPPPCAARDALS